MKTIKNILLLIFTLSSTIVLSQNAKEISKKASDAVDLDAMEMISTLKIYDTKGNIRTRQTATATKKFGQVSKTLLRFLAPADVKGTGMLIYDYENKSDEIWIYMPAIRKTRRIINSEKSKSFMGSEFTNADMSKPNLNDYRYKLLGIENFNGAACWKIHFEPINENIEDENGFSKKIAWINKKNNLVQKVEYYDLDGELHKIMLIKNYKLVDTAKKRYFAYYMEIKNVQTGRKSTLKIDKFQMGSSMKESNFSPASLSK